MKERRIEKAIKKAQKKGIYNPKLKLGIVGLILVIGTVLGISYAYYTYRSSSVLTINATVSKKINIKVTSSGNGKVNSTNIATGQADYNNTATFTLSPDTNYEYDSISCNPTTTTTRSGNTLYITPKTSKDVTCTVTFKEKKIKVSVSSNGNGSVTPSSREVTYNTSATFTVSPNTGYKYSSVSCSPSVTTNYANGTLTVTPTNQNVTCTVTFERSRTGQEIVDKIKQNVKSTEVSNAAFANGCPLSNDDSCSGIYKMTDYSSSTSLNYSSPGGTSYYYRGAVENNYVKFANKIWRIVRINGDGTIRLVLNSDIGISMFNESYFANKYVGYTYDNNQPCTNSSPCTSTYNNSTTFTNSNGGTNSTIKKTLEEWYYNNLRNYDNYITYGIYCNDTSYGSGSETNTLKYGAHVRLRSGSSSATPQLICPDPVANSTTASSSDTSNGNHTYGGIYKLKIGLLSADETVLAGFKTYVTDPHPKNSNYLNYTNPSNIYFWSLSPFYSYKSSAYFFYGWLGGYNGMNYNLVNDERDTMRPVINLKADTSISSGDGSSGNPYIIGS